jgi:nucleotide-binding universal stress UspA family protein
MVAYDGSAESRAAVHAAVTLFPGRRLIVVTVWETGLAMAMASASSTALRSSGEGIAGEVAQLERAEVAQTAREGAELARGLGATGEAIAVTEDLHAAVAVASEADRRDPCVIVVGSRGLGRVKAPLLGSTSQGLLRHTKRPVLVVQDRPA